MRGKAETLPLCFRRLFRRSNRLLFVEAAPPRHLRSQLGYSPIRCEYADIDVDIKLITII